MNRIEQEILENLVKLAQEAKTIRAGERKPDLRPLFARIDELAARLPLDAHPDLIHYLRRKSYEKARQWLEEHCRGGSGAEAGK
jgi:hypothetical protein